MINCFHRGFGKFQSFIKFLRKDIKIIKCKKVKFGAYQGGGLVLLSFVEPLVNFLIYMNPLHGMPLVTSCTLKVDKAIGISHMAILEKKRGKKRA